MSKDLEYFKDFLENPSSFKVKEFYLMLHEFVDYLKAHKDDFNYLKDEEWREVRERLIVAVKAKNVINDEFERLESKLNSFMKIGLTRETVAVYKEWLEFLKRNQVEYAVTDTDIKESEEDLKKLTQELLNYEITGRMPNVNDINTQKAVEKLDNSIFESYQRTGKRPILNVLQTKQGKKGN